MPTSYPYTDPTDPLRVARFVFGGWKDAERKKQFHGSVSFLSQEAAAFRFQPSFKDTGIWFIEPETAEQNEVGTVPGSVLQVPFNSDFTTIEKVKKWFNEAGLIIHPAESPYLDLTKGLKTSTSTTEDKRFKK